MKDLESLTSIQIYNYPSDQLPFGHLLTADAINAIKTAFNFQKHELESSADGSKTISIEFLNGSLKEGDDLFPIQRVLFSNDTIAIKIVGKSPIGVHLLTQIHSVVKSISRRFSPTPVLIAEETSSVVTLDIPFTAVFSPGFLTFNQIASKLAGASDQDVLEPRGFRLIFVNKNDADIVENGPLGPKKITIEPRVGVPLDRQRYYFSTPTNWEAHTKLIELFEKNLLTEAGRPSKLLPAAE